MKISKKSILWKKSYFWLTLVFFLGSLILHWLFGWKQFVEEQAEHGQLPQVGEYVQLMLRDTMENWQSEFLQLMWQVAGLALFVYVGSPNSKEGEERKEEKIDHIIRQLDPENYEALQAKWNKKYPKE
jgi:hypothetical protein